MFKFICITSLSRPSCATDKEILVFDGKPDGSLLSSQDPAIGPYPVSN
jgi:hypothetical protein